ncbi:MAG TPA: heme exporter protein CcmB [Armatimonadota bacterium]|jgi:heme exporter protein B
MATLSSGWAEGAVAVLAKELRTELRGKVALSSLLLFSVTTLSVVSFTLAGVAPEARVSASFLWAILLFASLSGLSRAFVREEETGTALALRLSSHPQAVFLGKLLFNMALLAVLEVLVAVLFTAMLGVRVPHPDMLVVLLVVGNAAVSLPTTLTAAIVSRASATGALFGVLSFPLLLPPLILLAKGSTVALGALASWRELIPVFRLLISYTGALFVVGLFLFEYIWREG